MKLNKTKIVATIGPASRQYETMKAMVDEGMDIVRINTSHATMEEITETVEIVNKLNSEGYHIATILDIKGPKIRCLDFEERIYLKKGERIKLVREQVIGNRERFSCNQPQIIDSIKLNNILCINDGLLELKVIDINEEIVLEALNDSYLDSRKGINIKNFNYDIQFFSEDDKRLVGLSKEFNLTYIALSFVQNAKNIEEVRQYLNIIGSKAGIISKIETFGSILNLEEIVKESDGIMVARGDLALEVESSEIPILQKKIIEKAREYNKGVIVATEMLASMENSMIPRRSELTDVCNAVFDCTDAVMMSGETSLGKYPVLAVRYMRLLSLQAEANRQFMRVNFMKDNNTISDVITNMAYTASNKMNAKLIVVPTTTGLTAKRMSNFRTDSDVIAITKDQEVAKRLALYYGVYPLVVKEFNTFREMLDLAIEHYKTVKTIVNGDVIIITGGTNNRDTDFIKIEKWER